VPHFFWDGQKVTLIEALTKLLRIRYSNGEQSIVEDRSPQLAKTAMPMADGGDRIEDCDNQKVATSKVRMRKFITRCEDYAVKVEI
jgi:hypothetical protein